MLQGPSLVKIGVVIAPTLALLACVEARDPGAERGAGLAVAVAPMSLPGVGRVCYDLRVTDGPTKDDPTIWARGTPGLNGGAGDPGAVCSSDYGSGAGGDITYVGTCVASPEDAGGGRTNSVTLWLDGLYDAADAYLPPDGEDGWQDPCPDGCTVTATCRENADTSVVLDLTIMRQANQGFFDVAVNFEDLFCSAKVDCVDDEGAPLALLFNPDTDGRDTTVVAAFACTAGAGAADTVLYRAPLVVTCGATTIELAPDFGTGNAWTTTNPDPAPTDAVWQLAVYAGDEALSCDGQPCNKRYWNVALGLDAAVDGCRLTTRMTASDGPLASHTTPAGSTYPFLEVDVALTDADGLVCGRHALNDGTGVATGYTTVNTPAVFEHAFDGMAFEGLTSTSCLELRQAGQTTSGTYTIDPDGAGAGAPLTVYCEMTTDGGGWTLVEHLRRDYLGTTAAVLPASLPAQTTQAKLADADIRALALSGQGETMIVNGASRYIQRYSDAEWGVFSSLGWTNVPYDVKASNGTWQNDACNAHFNNRGFSTWSDWANSPCATVFAGSPFYMTSYHTQFCCGNVFITSVYVR